MHGEDAMPEGTPARRGFIAGLLLLLALCWTSVRLGAAQLESGAHQAFWKGEYGTALSRYGWMEKLGPPSLVAKEGQFQILLGAMDRSANVGRRVGMDFQAASTGARNLLAGIVESAPLRPETWAEVADFYGAIKLENQQHRVYSLQSISSRPEQNLEPEDLLEIRALEMSTQMDPNGFYYWDTLGDLCWSLALRSLALRAYEEAVTLQPFPNEHLFLGALQLDPELEEMTVRAMQRALYPPRNADPETLNRNLGFFLMRHGKFADARVAFEKAGAATPRGGYFSLQAFAASHSGQDEDAIRLYRKALALDRPQDGGRFRDYLSLGELLEKQGKHKEAARAVRAALGLNSRDPRALLLLAGILETLGEDDEAEDFYLRSAASSAEPITALANLVEFYRRTDRPERALVAARRLVQLQPDEAVYRELVRQLSEEVHGRRGH
jgi:tetratricopeptide (TPR) repeat protein